MPLILGDIQVGFLRFLACLLGYACQKNERAVRELTGSPSHLADVRRAPARSSGWEYRSCT